jgi:hypothetical protein
MPHCNPEERFIEPWVNEKGFDKLNLKKLGNIG